MHSLTTPARVLVGALLAIGLIVAGTTTAIAKPDAGTNREIVPGTSERSTRVASSYGCNTSAPPHRLACYGAIYYSPSRDAVGFSTDYRNATYANRRAYKECAKHSGTCRRITTFRNTCAALALVYSGGQVVSWGYGKNYYNEWDAVRRAKKEAGPGAQTRGRACTSRYRPS
ncbi:DUF4189 domain-containing protein [Nocardioides speluncae]|uniref:DUF4189 domain-containing protein n=1 Tax=Nocardioides speluncae TaxID=2670337 RepID=UPI000D694652|nr:DUF4189 domain-containing protein [Nocardioides speluncae]